jgi:hypothetical protein
MLGGDVRTFHAFVVAILALERSSAKTLNVSLRDNSCFGGLLAFFLFGQLHRQLRRQFQPQLLYRNLKKKGLAITCIIKSSTLKEVLLFNNLL